MMHSKLKLLIYFTVSLTLLFAPFLLEISIDGKANAMGFLGGGSGGGSSGSKISIKKPESDPGSDPDPGPGDGTIRPNPGTNPPTPVPEPATMLLVGGGALGLAALRKKFRKK